MRLHREVGFEPQLSVYQSVKCYTDIIICGRKLLCNREFQDEKGWVTTVTREYHEKSGRLVRIDKFHTVESKKEKARIATAEWRKRNPRAR